MGNSEARQYDVRNRDGAEVMGQNLNESDYALFGRKQELNVSDGRLSSVLFAQGISLPTGYQASMTITIRPNLSEPYGIGAIICPAVVLFPR